MGQGTAHLTQEILLAGGPRPVTPLLLVSETPLVAQWAAEYGSPHLLNPPLLCSASELLSALLLSQEKSYLQTSWPGWDRASASPSHEGKGAFLLWVAKLVCCTFLAPLRMGKPACGKAKMERKRGRPWIELCLKPHTQTCYMNLPSHQQFPPTTTLCSFLTERGFLLKTS